MPNQIIQLRDPKDSTKLFNPVTSANAVLCDKGGGQIGTLQSIISAIMQAQGGDGGGGSTVTIPDTDVTLSTTISNYITVDGISRNIKLPSSSPWSNPNLEELSNVTITSPSADQVLKYNGSGWINGTISSGSSTLVGLTDTNISSPINDQILKYSSGTWTNANMFLDVKFTDNNGVITCDTSISNIKTASTVNDIIVKAIVPIYPLGYVEVIGSVIESDSQYDPIYVFFIFNTGTNYYGYIGSSTYNNGVWTDTWTYGSVDVIPSQSGNSGKFLTTNGSAVSWADIPSELPAITGNANKILAVNSGATGVEWITNSGGGGSSTLAGLTDTNIVTPEEGNILKYNRTTSKWVNSAPLDLDFKMHYDENDTSSTINIIFSSTDKRSGSIFVLDVDDPSSPTTVASCAITSSNWYENYLWVYNISAEDIDIVIDYFEDPNGNNSVDGKFVVSSPSKITVPARGFAEIGVAMFDISDNQTATLGGLETFVAITDRTDLDLTILAS